LGEFQNIIIVLDKQALSVTCKCFTQST